MGPRGQRKQKAPRSVPPCPKVGEDDADLVSGSSLECPVCFMESEYFSVGLCNHIICQECSVRMRVLLEANECPICRQNLREVYHSRSRVSFPKSSALSELLDKKAGIRFEDPEVRDRFRAFKRHICCMCPKEKPLEFPSFEQLETHCRREHELFYCSLCAQHLKLFTYERRLYNRTQLAVHRRKGDSDDKSHKGHPNCKFCDTRFMDNEDLFLHLRKEHYFCHFCDSDGHHNDFYPNYNSLREHFGEDHYLCTEGPCLDTQFTHAFRTEIDFKAHRVEVHGNSFSKYDARLNRTVDLDLNYKNRRAGGNKPRGGGGGGKRNPETPAAVFEEPVQVLPDVNSAENFPSLGGLGRGIPRSASGDELARKKKGGKWKNTNGAGGEDFPSLGEPSGGRKNVAQRIRESDGRNSSAWGGSEAPQQRNRAKIKPTPLPKSRAEEFPGLDPPSQKKKGKQKDTGNNLQGAADVISNSSNSSSNSSNWSVVSSSKPKKQQPSYKNANSDASSNSVNNNIPGLNYSAGARSIPEETPPQQGSSVQGLVEDFPSLGPSSNKISAHFQPNSRDPIPNQWDSVSSPELFLPSASSEAVGGARPKSSVPKKARKPLVSGGAPSVYNPPNDFAQRNKKLLSLIMRILGGKSLEFKEFMTVSKKFRDESISCAEFYDRCAVIVGNNNRLMEFLPELIFLLPEIKKQQELYKIHKKKNAFLKIVNVQECEYCHQILSSKDFLQHEVTHSLDGDFPSLYAAAS